MNEHKSNFDNYKAVVMSLFTNWFMNDMNSDIIIYICDGRQTLLVWCRSKGGTDRNVLSLCAAELDKQPPQSCSRLKASSKGDLVQINKKSHLGLLALGF